jgi:hypothetical protein
MIGSGSQSLLLRPTLESKTETQVSNYKYYLHSTVLRSFSLMLLMVKHMYWLISYWGGTPLFL